MTEIKCLTIDELKSALKDMGEKPFRAGQIFKWLHEGVQSFDEMSNLSKELRARLAENFILTVPEVARKQVSRGRRHGKVSVAHAATATAWSPSSALRARRFGLASQDAGRLPHGWQILQQSRPERPKAHLSAW